MSCRRTPVPTPRGGRRRVAPDGAGARRGAEPSGGVGPYRRYEGNPSRGRAEHAGRAGAICRRARPDFEVWGRKEDAHGGSPGGHPRSSVGCFGVWGGGGNRIHLPLWLAEQLGAQADGDVANGSDRAGTIHGRGDGASVLWWSPP